MGRKPGEDTSFICKPPILPICEPLLRLCPQSVEALSPEITAFAEAWDSVSRRVLGQLGLEPGALERWPTLSPGERKRWQIGAALASEPDVLLLDEPTNHLDAEACGWLISALRRFRGIGLVVSHDRTVLEELTTTTLRVHAGEAAVARGLLRGARVLGVRALPQAGAAPGLEEESPTFAATVEEPLEGAHTAFGLTPGCSSRTFALDVFACVRCGGRLEGVGVREGSRRGESDSGAPGVAHGECAPVPRARAAPERRVLKLEPPQPAKRARPLPRPAWEGRWAGQACVCWR